MFILIRAKRFFGTRFGMFASSILPGIALAATVCAAQLARAARTPVALVSGTPEGSAVAACINASVIDSGPVVSAERLAEGLEFRIGLLGAAGAQQLVTITALLKPNVTALTESHDNEPEAQPAAASRFYRLLRVHVGTRAWLWRREGETEICREAATWIKQLRSRPILFDRIGVDGEPR